MAAQLRVEVRLCSATQVREAEGIEGIGLVPLPRGLGEGRAKGVARAVKAGLLRHLKPL